MSLTIGMAGGVHAHPHHVGSTVYHSRPVTLSGSNSLPLPVASSHVTAIRRDLYYSSSPSHSPLPLVSSPASISSGNCSELDGGMIHRSHSASSFDYHCSHDVSYQAHLHQQQQQQQQAPQSHSQLKKRKADVLSHSTATFESYQPAQYVAMKQQQQLQQQQQQQHHHALQQRVPMVPSAVPAARSNGSSPTSSVANESEFVGLIECGILKSDAQRSIAKHGLSHDPFVYDTTNHQFQPSPSSSPSSSPAHDEEGNVIGGGGCRSPSRSLTGDEPPRIFYEHSAFFGKSVEVYKSPLDPYGRVLYRGSALAEKYDCPTNKIGMYFARHRGVATGVFQATNFKYKPSGRTGLKSGSYFVSIEACIAFENRTTAHNHQPRTTNTTAAAVSANHVTTSSTSSATNALLSSPNVGTHPLASTRVYAAAASPATKYPYGPLLSPEATYTRLEYNPAATATSAAAAVIQSTVAAPAIGMETSATVSVIPTSSLVAPSMRHYQSLSIGSTHSTAFSHPPSDNESSAEVRSLYGEQQVNSPYTTTSSFSNASSVSASSIAGSSIPLKPAVAGPAVDTLSHVNQWQSLSSTLSLGDEATLRSHVLSHLPNVPTLPEDAYYNQMYYTAGESSRMSTLMSSINQSVQQTLILIAPFLTQQEAQKLAYSFLVMHPVTSVPLLAVMHKIIFSVLMQPATAWSCLASMIVGVIPYTSSTTSSLPTVAVSTAGASTSTAASVHSEAVEDSENQALQHRVMKPQQPEYEPRSKKLAINPHAVASTSGYASYEDSVDAAYLRMQSSVVHGLDGHSRAPSAAGNHLHFESYHDMEGGATAPSANHYGYGEHHKEKSMYTLESPRQYAMPIHY